jgi:hypothetical protein
VRLQSNPQTSAEVAERVRSILGTRNLTLYQVSQKSEAIFGHASPYCLPHNFYYDLKLGSFSPSLYQIFALSRISDYRFADWLHVLGFDLEEIPRLQVLLPSKRTILLDSSLGDPSAWIPWFQNKAGIPLTPPVAPLGQLLELRDSVRQHSLVEVSKQKFLYAKVGVEDALAFPDVLPGSIVRVNPRGAANLPAENGKTSGNIFLIEHSKGLCCCRVQTGGKNRIILPVSTQLPYAQVELRLHREVRILGSVDLEVRPLVEPDRPRIPADLAKRWRPGPVPVPEEKLSQLFRRARSKMALSIREASALSRRVADALGDERFFMSPSSLSDYEARDSPPRHFHKAVTLCVLYAVPFQIFLNHIDLAPGDAGKESVPDHLIPRASPAGSQVGSIEPDQVDSTGFLGELLRRWEDVPLFLRRSIGDISDLTSPSLHDAFWVGGVRDVLHPYLLNGLLVIVDRHKKKPIDSRSKPFWQQSLYVVLKRDGAYFCGCCGIENGTLVVHPQPERVEAREEFRNQLDAEVVGQIVTIMRRFL